MTPALNSKKIKKNKVSLVVLNTLILGILILITLHYLKNTANPNWSSVITIISLLLLSYQLIIFRKLNVSFANYGLWFMILSNIFMFSRVYLNAFRMDQDIFWDLLARYPDDLLFKTSLILLCILQAFFLGYMLVQKRVNKKPSKTKDIKNILIYNTGLILILISLPFRIYNDISDIIQTQSSSSYISLEVSSGLSGDVALLFIPGIIYVLSSRKFSRNTNFIFLVITITYLIGIMILTGDRRYSVTAIISLVLCYMSIYNVHISIKKIFSYGLFSILLLNLLSVIRNIRRNDLTNISSFFNEYGKFIITNNPILETLSEFGLSFFSVVAVVKNVPDIVPYQKGLSFIGSIPSILPIGWIFGDFFHRVSISNVINSIEGYPVGATIFGDMFANFGWFSILFFILFGSILAKVFNINTKEYSHYQYANYFSLFYILINLVRSSFFEMVRTTFIVYVIPLLVIKTLKIKLK